MNPKELMVEYLNTRYEIERLKKIEQSLYDKLFSEVSVSGPITIDEKGIHAEASIKDVTSYIVDSKWYPYFDYSRSSAVLHDGTRVSLESVQYKKMEIDVRDSVN